MITRTPIFGLLGVAAFIVCALACRPAFSPDGQQVLYVTMDDNAKETRLLLHHRQARTTKVLFRQPWGDHPLIATAVWTPDGKQALFAAGDLDNEEPVRATLIAVDGKTTNRVFVLPQAVRTSGLMQPPPILGRRAFFSGAGVVRLDLDTGETRLAAPLEPADGDDDLTDLVFAAARQLFYLTVNQKSAAVGQLDPDRLTRTPRFEVQADDEGLSVWPAVSKDGTRMALAARQQDQTKLFIYRGHTLERALALGALDSYRLGNLVWSADEEQVFAAAFRPVEAEEKEIEFLLAEVPVSEGKPRLTSICRVPVDRADEMPMQTCQISRSPDGSTIAAGVILPENDTGSLANGLYLVSVSGSARPVTKVPLPENPPPPAEDQP